MSLHNREPLHTAFTQPPAGCAVPLPHLTQSRPAKTGMSFSSAQLFDFINFDIPAPKPAAPSSKRPRSPDQDDPGVMFAPLPLSPVRPVMGSGACVSRPVLTSSTSAPPPRSPAGASGAPQPLAPPDPAPECPACLADLTPLSPGDAIFPMACCDVPIHATCLHSILARRCSQRCPHCVAPFPASLKPEVDAVLRQASAVHRAKVAAAQGQLSRVSL